MKIIEVRYLGKYLGGHAVVLAKTEKGAEKLVREDPETIDFIKVSTRVLTDNFTKQRVLTNNNGDW